MVNIVVVVLLVSAAFMAPAAAQDEVVIDESRIEEAMEDADDARIERMLKRADEINEQRDFDDGLAYEDVTEDDVERSARFTGRGENDDAGPPEEPAPDDISGREEAAVDTADAEPEANLYRSGSGLSGAYRSSFMGEPAAPAKTFRPVEKAGAGAEAAKKQDDKKKRY